MPMPDTDRNSQFLQRGQKKCRCSLGDQPASGSPRVISNPLAGSEITEEKALALRFWHQVQWQASVSRGGALTRNRRLPQRHPPSHGRLQWSDMQTSRQVSRGPIGTGAKIIHVGSGEVMYRLLLAIG